MGLSKTIAYPIEKNILQKSRRVFQSRLRNQINNSSIQEQARVYRELTQNNNNNVNSRYEQAKRRRARKKLIIPGKKPQSIDEKLGMKPRGTVAAEIAKEKFLKIE